MNKLIHSICIKKIDQKVKFLKCKKMILGNGLLPPKKIKVINKSLNKNYIWDFYSEGGTHNLLQKIKKFKNEDKNLLISSFNVSIIIWLFQDSFHL